MHRTHLWFRILVLVVATLAVGSLPGGAHGADPDGGPVQSPVAGPGQAAVTPGRIVSLEAAPGDTFTKVGVPTAPSLNAPAVNTATFVVNSAADNASDGSPGDGLCETVPGNGVCTLRAAIQEAAHR